MKPILLTVLAALVLAPAAAAPLVAQSSAPTSSALGPVVLELFTSQGCSSCPPADSLMARMAREPGLLVLSRPVTYWDDLGWKDTLGREANTSLQRAYAAKDRSHQGAYTPEVVVGGAAGTIGSNEGAIRALIDAVRHLPAASLVVARRGDGGFGVGVAGPGAGEVILVALSASEPVIIGRGENAGNTVTYTNVVRDERRLGGWSGGTASFAITPAMLHTPHADRYALMVRQPGGGRILAARMLVEG